jgi:hypothetical protein
MTRHELAPDQLDLHAQLVQSVGAALLNVGVALAASGDAVDVRRLSRPNGHDLLAAMERGVPPAVVPRLDDEQGDEPRSRDSGTPADGRPPVRTHCYTGRAPVLLTTADDDQPGWRQAREALQRLWLELTRLGLAATPIALQLPMPQTSNENRTELAGGAHPQLLLLIGAAQPTPPSRRARAEAVTGSLRPPLAPPVHDIPRVTGRPGRAGERRPIRPVTDGRGGTTWI